MPCKVRVSQHFNKLTVTKFHLSYIYLFPKQLNSQFTYTLTRVIAQVLCKIVNISNHNISFTCSKEQTMQETPLLGIKMHDLSNISSETKRKNTSRGEILAQAKHEIPLTIVIPPLGRNV